MFPAEPNLLPETETRRPDEDQRYGFTEELTERAEDGRATGTVIDLLAIAAAEPKRTVQSDSSV